MLVFPFGASCSTHNIRGYPSFLRSGALRVYLHCKLFCGKKQWSVRCIEVFFFGKGCQSSSPFQNGEKSIAAYLDDGHVSVLFPFDVELHESCLSYCEQKARDALCTRKRAHYGMGDVYACPQCIDQS